jgi:hypothetical protein
MNGIDTTHIPEMATYDCLIQVADHKMDRQAFDRIKSLQN